MIDKIYRTSKEKLEILKLIRRSLDEDIGTGDITSSLLDKTQVSHGEILSRQAGVVCGLELAWLIYEEVSNEVIFEPLVEDGELISESQVLCKITGPTVALLVAERIVLNFLSRLSGIATTTHSYVERAKGVPVIDTRKTTPTMRLIEKYAVRVGGGQNHRFGLYDRILIKDNHIASLGGIDVALRRFINHPKAGNLEVEVHSIDQLELIVPYTPPAVLLDNFSVSDLKVAINTIRKRLPGTKIEVSGGVTLESIRQIANLRPDYISVGALTSGTPRVDISFVLRQL